MGKKSGKGELGEVKASDTKGLRLLFQSVKHESTVRLEQYKNGGKNPLPLLLTNYSFKYPLIETKKDSAGGKGKKKQSTVNCHTTG